MAYCVYTGASVRLQSPSTRHEDAASALGVFLRALKGGLSTCPVLSRSIDIINNRLSRLNSCDVPSTVAEIDSTGLLDFELGGATYLNLRALFGCVSSAT